MSTHQIELRFEVVSIITVMFVPNNLGIIDRKLHGRSLSSSATAYTHD